MKRISRYFIDNSFLVNLITVMMIIFGLISLSGMRRDLISGWKTPIISITNSLIGAGPEQVEKFVTIPIEQAIKSIPGIDKIKSESSQGFSKIDVFAKDDVKDIKELEQLIKDSISNIKSTLPSEVSDSSVKHIKQTEAWFSSYALTGFDENNDAHQDWFFEFKQRLNRISGITRISDDVRKKQIYIKLKPGMLSRYQLTTSEVYNKVIDSFRLFPIGMISKGSDDYLVEIENAKFEINALSKIVIRANNSNHKILLKDIASITRRLDKQRTREYLNKESAVNFWIFKEIKVDTIDLKNNVEEFIANETKKTPDQIKINLVGDGPSFIERQIYALKSNSIFGIVLVILTLMAFLGMRNSMMTSLGIPLAYCFTFFVLSSLDISIDLISVVGMLLVLGILVDDAIIIAEQYSQNLEKGLRPKDAAVEAVQSTWVPITGAALTTMVAFFPILLSNDGFSSIMMAIPIVVISALGVSLFECFFILPNHLVHFVKKPQKQNKLVFLEKMKSLYKKGLKRSLRLRYLSVPMFVVFMGYSLYFAQKNIPMNFNLNISSETVRLTAILKDSNNLDESQQKIAKIWDSLDKLDQSRFQYITARSGSLWQNGKLRRGPQYNSFRISFSQLDENVEANKKYVEEFLEKEIKELEKSGDFETLEVKRRFDGQDESKNKLIEVIASSQASIDIDQVDNLITKELEEVKGITSIDPATSKLVDSWTFKPNMDAIFAYGLNLRDLSIQLRNYVTNDKVYEYRSGPEILSIYSFIKDGETQTLDSLRNTEILLANGNFVKTKELGDWVVTRKEKDISHEDLKRTVVYNINYDEKIATQESLLKTLAPKLEKLSKQIPYGELKVRDADEQARKNKKSVSQNVLYAVVGIFFVLALILKSVSAPIIICTAIPFGVIGVIWAFYFQNLKLDTMAFIGIIGMAGVVVNDSLMLFTTLNRLKEKFGVLSPEVIMEGSSQRLRPIILTSITTLGGVFPMAYGIGGDAGFTKPLAMSMGWGLLFATALTLFLIPSLVQIQEDIK